LDIGSHSIDIERRNRCRILTQNPDIQDISMLNTVCRILSLILLSSRLSRAGDGLFLKINQIPVGHTSGEQGGKKEEKRNY
jgi:hypothetical protein